MTAYLTLDDVIALHDRGIEAFGGEPGIRDLGLVESAVMSPQASFGGVEFYEDVVVKAAVFGYSLAKNHGFIDGNKRVAFIAMSTFLGVNEHSIDCTPDEGETIFLSISSGAMTRDQFVSWVESTAEPNNPAEP